MHEMGNLSVRRLDDETMRRLRLRAASSAKRSPHRSGSATWQSSYSDRLTEWISKFPNVRHTNPCPWRHDPGRHQRRVEGHLTFGSARSEPWRKQRPLIPT